MRIAEHVVDLIAVDHPLLLDLLEEPREDLAFPRLMGNEVPQVAGTLLTDAVDAPEPLLDAVGIPGQVVVDHHVGDLQVDALSRRIGGHQHLHGRIHPEPLLQLPAVVALDAAVDGDHRLGAAEFGPYAVDHVVERVLVLGEDDQLAGADGGGGILGRVWSFETAVAAVARGVPTEAPPCAGACGVRPTWCQWRWIEPRRRVPPTPSTPPPRPPTPGPWPRRWRHR